MDRPLATCYACSATVEHKKYNSFSYWWCPKCKDEPASVRLATIRHPKGEKYGYAKEDNDYVLSAPGVYKLVYLDDTIEFYERSAGCNDLILDGSRIRSAKRLTESDLPSRKPVQSLATTGKGAQQEGQGSPSVRPLSNQASSVPGRTSLPVYTWNDTWPKAGEEFLLKPRHTNEKWRHFHGRDADEISDTQAEALAPDYFNKPPFFVSSPARGALPPGTKAEMQNIFRCPTGIQLREVLFNIYKSECNRRYFIGSNLTIPLLKSSPDDEL